MIKFVKPEDVLAMQKKGAIALDTRADVKFMLGCIPDAVNVDQVYLAEAANVLDKDVTYLVCCNSGNSAQVHSLMLNQKGFDTYVVEGGFAAYKEFAEKK